MRYLALGTLVCLSSPALTQTASYDFSGDLGSQFVAYDNAVGISSSQSGGQLEFHSGGSTLSGKHTESFVHTSWSPTLENEFAVSVDFGLPFHYNTSFSPILIEQYVRVGIATVLQDPGLAPRVLLSFAEVYSGEYEFNKEIDRNLGHSILFEDYEPFKGWYFNSQYDAGRLTLTWDPVDKCLKTDTPRGDLNVCIDDRGLSNFHVGDDITFDVIVFVEVSNCAISPEFPLTIDTFEGVILEPPCRPDFNGDGIVDLGDISTFIDLFLANDPAADTNEDSIIDLGDITTFIEFFLAGCP